MRRARSIAPINEACPASTYLLRCVCSFVIPGRTVPQQMSEAYLRRRMQAVGLILIFLVGFGVPAGSVLCFFIPSLRRRLQEHSRLPKNYIEHQPGYYLVRDQHWSRFTTCRQFKPGSAKVVACQGGQQPLTVSYERFWLSVEMTWKLSVLLLPLTIADSERGLKYLPGAISTIIMLVAQSVRKRIDFASIPSFCW